VGAEKDNFIRGNEFGSKLVLQRQSIMNAGGNLMCVPGITYKSILSPSSKLNSSKVKAINEHPLSSQQLLNGYKKNPAASQGRSGRKAQDRMQHQGIQGKNISMMN